MPYNVSSLVSSLSGDRTERVYCETAAKALARISRCNDDGHTEVHAISVEGIDVPVDRLTMIARSEIVRPKLGVRFG